MLAGGLERLRLAGVPESEIPDSLKRVESSVTDRGPGAHPLTGPIFVEGAEPGDVVEVRILAFEFLYPNCFSVPRHYSVPCSCALTRISRITSRSRELTLPRPLNVIV